MTYLEYANEVARLAAIRPMTLSEIRAAMAAKIPNALHIAEGNRQALNRFKTVRSQFDTDGKYRFYPVESK
jgi:hypothetical protein